MTEAMADPTTPELQAAAPGSVDTQALRFTGSRGDPTRHLSRAELIEALGRLPAAPRDAGVVELLVARGRSGERELPGQVVLTAAGGMPGDRWATEDKYGPEYQLATTRSDVARLVANGQPLELHGDNVYVTLDLSAENLPQGSRVRMGEALVCVTPKAHNGCKKWVQRFGLDAMQLNLSPEFRSMHLRGIYFEVVEDGLVRVGDPVVVVQRGPTVAG